MSTKANKSNIPTQTDPPVKRQTRSQSKDNKPEAHSEIMADPGKSGDNDSCLRTEGTSSESHNSDHPRTPKAGRKVVDIDITGSDSESEAENEDEIQKEEAHQMATFAKAMLGGQAITERDVRKVGTCDGSDSDKTLRWLRLTSTVTYPFEIARLTAEGPLAAFLAKRKTKDWPTIRQKIAEMFISAAFQQNQREALERLSQRSGESLTKFNHEFQLLLQEAYDELPMDQEGLIRAYLSAIDDRRLAMSVLNGDRPTTLQEAVKAAIKKDRAKGLLKPKKTGKASELTPINLTTPEMSALTRAVEALVQSNHDLHGQVAEIKTATQTKPKVEKGPVKCYRCGKPGHFARECQTKVPSTQQREEKTFLAKCDRCRQTTHTIRECRAGPPKKPCYCGGSHWLYDCPARRMAAQPQQNQGN